MKNAFVFKVLSLFTILSLMFSGVFAGGVQRVSAASSDLSVGIVLPVAYGHWLQDQASFQERIQASGLAAEVLFSDGDAATEKANVEYLISKGIKVLIITPQDSSANAAVLEEAQAAGVKIICYDRLVRDTEAVDFYITFDNVGVGRAMGQYLINHAQGTGNSLYLYAGAAYDNNSYLFFEGAWEVLQPKIADGTFSIKNSSEAVALQNSPTLTRDQESTIINQINTNWDYSTAQALAAANLNAMAADEKGNVFILAPNDNTARAIADVFMTDPDVTSYVITGQDAERDSVQYIIDGKQSMTVFKDFRTTVDDALAAAKVFLDGGIPIASTTTNNGMIDVPTKLSAVTVVDKSNFKSVLIDSGYYQDSDFTYHHPTILANPSSHWVHALDWPIDTELTLTIGDYSATTTTVVASWDPNTVDGYFDLTGQVDLAPEDVVTVTGEGITKTLLIANFAVSELDVMANTLSGMASPGGFVCAGADNAPGDARCATAGVDGIWNIEPITGGFVLGAGVSGWAVEFDSDGDQTRMDWRVPSPRFDVRANIDQVEGYEWKIGESVTLQVGDYSETKTVEETASWDSNLSYVAFNLSGKYDIQAGDVVTLTNGTITKTTIVTPLEITSFDRAMDTVSGKAASNTSVDLWGCDADNCYNRHVTADESGNWLADFANPGSAEDEQNTLDIVSGTWVDSQQVDDDGDTTMYGKNVPIPTHHIYTYNIKTGEVIQITNIPNTSEWNPSWSPNGKQIAYDVSFEDGTQAIYITDIKTRVSTPLEGAEGGNDAVWSPNGLWIAFDTNYTDTPNLYVVSPNGGEKKLIRENAVAPSWSPNSQRIVFKDLSDGGKLKTIGLVGGLEITVADVGENPAWSPDGKWIAYVLDGDIWKVRVDPFGTPLAQPIQLTNLDGWEDQPAWSVDSKTIVFQSGSSIDDYDLWSVSADGGIPVPLYGTLMAGEYDPDFAHNGLIVFSGPAIVP